MIPITDGSPTSQVWLLGEAPGEHEWSQGRPFVGPSGWHLNEALRRAGIARRDCFLSNVAHERPPTYYRNGKPVNNDISQWFPSQTEGRKLGYPLIQGRRCAPEIVAGLAYLRELLTSHRPNLIIAFGDTALWALTGLTGITKWRGSELEALPEYHSVKLIPTLHPAAVMQHLWPQWFSVDNDLRRARREMDQPHVTQPHFDVTIPTSASEARAWFAKHTSPGTPLTADIEGWAVIDCIGFGSSSGTAICIPFRHLDPGLPVHYWSSIEEEQEIVELVSSVARSHPLIFHNGMWDTQMLTSWWGLAAQYSDDTMIAQHVAFPSLLGGKLDPVTGKATKQGSSLSLSYIASLYCEHYRFWKDDGRLFDPAEHDERRLWFYNGEDCCRTYECHDVLDGVLREYHLRKQYRTIMSFIPASQAMMFHGLRVDRAGLRDDAAYLERELLAVGEWLDTAVGQPFNPASNPQMQSLFYDALSVQRVLHRKTKQATLDDNALSTIARRQRLLAPLCRQIQNWRSLSTREDFVNTDRLSADGRFHFACNLTGQETFRISTNEDAFGDGANTQNWPRPDKE